MYRLVYVSEATSRLMKMQVSQIVKSSRLNNGRVDITGMLVFYENRFFQVLEGPYTAVKATFERILLDSRHRCTAIIDQTETRHRAFPSWRMGYSDPFDLEPDVRNNVFRIYDLIPRDSVERGNETAVRNHVRQFLAEFDRFQNA